MLNKASKVLLSPWLAIATVLLLLSVKLMNPFLVDSMKLKYYDYLMLGEPVKSENMDSILFQGKHIAKLLAIFMGQTLVSLAVLYLCLSLIGWGLIEYWQIP
jgi:hypothetical protein